MYDLDGNPITISFVLLNALLGLRLGLEYNVTLVHIVLKFIRRIKK